MGQREVPPVSLRNPQAFFEALRTGLLGPTLTAEEVKGTNAVLDAMEGSPLSWTAYALATAYHETASTMQPVKEYGGPTYFTRMYDVSGARPQLCSRTAIPVPATE
jgi:putative chitinase